MTSDEKNENTGSLPREYLGSTSATIAAFSRIIELRDPYTYGHQQRVGHLAQAIALAMGIEADLALLIRHGGEMHDIGKICVPLELLLRGPALTPQEYAVIRRHPEEGARILTLAKVPWPIAEIAHQHHERPDGSGYPLGLRGDEILLPARIVTVADTVDAMANFRPYQPAHGIEKALAYVADNAGTIYDAQVSTACAAVFERGYQFLGDGTYQPSEP
jgi:putative nucleotidyltransferase with HDIG domain